MENLMSKYQSQIMPTLEKELGIKNKMAVPRLKKIVVNVGVKDALNDKKNIEIALDVLGVISGQKPASTSLVYTLPGQSCPGLVDDPIVY